MNISLIDALKSSDFDLRITSHRNNAWLLWDSSQWVVYQKVPYARDATVLYRGDYLDEAVGYLTSEG